MQHAPDALVGHTFAGRFLLHAHIGAGGMGDVYRGEDLRLGQVVALKIVHERHARDPEILGRVRREVATSQRIEHRNTVRVFDSGQGDDGRPWISMELLEGKPLDKVILDDAPVPLGRALQIGAQILRALEAAHAQGIVHRDLKPENVMICPGDLVKLLDFGLSRVVETAPDPLQDDPTESIAMTTLTQAGVRVGTPLYMAPEYITSFATEPRSDLYAVGVILYELTAGVAPFTGRPSELFDRTVKEKPAPPRSHNPRVPTWLDALIVQMLAKRPTDRPASAKLVAEELERKLASLPTVPTDDELSPSPPPPRTPDRTVTRDPDASISKEIPTPPELTDPRPAGAPTAAAGGRGALARRNRTPTPVSIRATRPLPDEGPPPSVLPPPGPPPGLVAATIAAGILLLGALVAGAIILFANFS